MAVKPSEVKEQKNGSEMQREENGTIKLMIKIPWSLVTISFDQRLAKAITNVEVPGFRKGKAPYDKAIGQVEKTAVYEEVIKELLPSAYAAAVEEHKLAPVVYPQIHIEKAKEGEDWEFSVIICEAPVVTLGDYKDRIQASFEGEKTNFEKKRGEKEKKELTAEEREQLALAAFMQVVKVKVPDMLVEREANHRLSHLIEKTEKLGVTIEQYLVSIHKTEQELKAQYAEEARRAIAIEAALNEVAKSEGLKVEDEEIKKLVEASGDEKIKQNLQAPEQQEALRGMLGRRKAFEYIAKLV